MLGKVKLSFAMLLEFWPIFRWGNMTAMFFGEYLFNLEWIHRMTIAIDLIDDSIPPIFCPRWTSWKPWIHEGLEDVFSYQLDGEGICWKFPAVHFSRTWWGFAEGVPQVFPGLIGEGETGIPYKKMP